MVQEICSVVKNLTRSDWIQIALVIVVIWYSIETYRLRKEQKKAVYLQLLDMEMRDKSGGYKSRVNYPLMVREIIELGKFDVKKLYSPAYHQPLKTLDKIRKWLKAKSRSIN